MIEIIYNEEGQEHEKDTPYVHLPKNIRQVGDTEKTRKIYIEDYAVTFIKQLTSDQSIQPVTAVLLGRVNWLEGVQYIFISGVLPIENMDAGNERILFDDRVWSEIYENMKKHFINQEIVGWFFCMPGYPIKISDAVFKTHITHFGGNDKVFMMRDEMENEDGFFLFENGRLSRQRGYYIYYDKNEAMQEYMVSQNAGKSVENSEEIPDDAIRNARRILQEKKESPDPGRMMGFLYAASTFLIITVLVIGITMINSHDKMKNMEETLASISQAISGDGQESLPASSVTVENAGSNIEKEEESESETADESADKTEGDSSNSESAPLDAALDEAENEGADGSTVQTEVQNTAEASNVSFPYTYVVQEGDSLAVISVKFYGTKDKIDEILEENQIENADKIFIGQKIVLP